MTIIIALLILLGLTTSKILQITQKNLPNVLRTLSSIPILYHHPDCKYSSTFKQKFTHLHNSRPQLLNQTVGVIDCFQQKHLCAEHNVTAYPGLAINILQKESEWLNADQYLSNITNQVKSDEYLASEIVQKLKSYPNFIVTLFEEQGMPVIFENRIKDSQFMDRIFPLCQGRTAETLLGFVGNRKGCWIFKLQQNGDLNSYQCGDTYQSSTLLLQNINSFVKGKLVPLVADDSDFKNETISGYKQLKYWIEHYETQLSLSKSNKISLCTYLYVWSKDCEHCDYQNDMKMTKIVVDRVYQQKNNQKLNKLTNYKHQINSYDVSSNQIIKFDAKTLSNLTGISENKIKTSYASEVLQLLPNLVSICFHTFDNTNLQNSLSLEFLQMNQIIGLKNIQKFIQKTLQNAQNFIESKNTQNYNEQL